MRSKWTVSIKSPGELEVSEFTAPSGDEVVIVPNFYGVGARANSAIIKIRDSAGKVLSMYALQINGITGKAVLHDILTPVVPAMEQRAARKLKPKKEPDAQPTTS